MRFTRNLVIAFSVLFLGLFYTGVNMFINAGSTPATKLSASVVILESEDSAPIEAIVPEKESRDTFIAKMKKELASRVSEIIVPAPVVTESENSTETNDSAAESETVVREIVWCDATVLEAQFASSWPNKNVSVVEREGARVVLESLPVETASGTVESLPRTLMQFPLSPKLRSEPTCLTNGYVGFTNEGRLIHNNDVVLYKSYSENDLVGYAFDGNPIYGTALDGSRLDICGGQKTSAGYRYSLRADEKFILGCFVSEPQQTVLGG